MCRDYRETWFRRDTFSRNFRWTSLEGERIFLVTDILLALSLTFGDIYLILLLFTSTFPYDGGAEQTFLSGELYHLKNAFDRVILIPQTCTGNRLPVPDGIEVDESLSRFLSLNRFTALPRALLSPILYKDIISRPSILFHPDPLKRLVKFMEIAYLTQLWT